MNWTHHKKTIIAIATLLLFFTGSLILVRCAQPDKKQNNEIANEYVGDKACISCHKSEHDEWQLSDHFKAMQPANDSTVLGNFNDTTFTADGVTSRFFKRDGKFFINTQGPDSQNHDYEIKYTFGFYPLQQYLVEFDRGRMQATRQSWNTKDKKWFHQYPGEKLAATDWLHWTGNGQNWNTMCAECHSTNLQKNYNSETDSYNTTFSVLTVSCEACHGPAKSHIDYINGDYKNGDKQAGSFLRAAKNSSQLSEIQTCFPCHARKSNLSGNLKNSSEIMDDYIPEIPSSEFFHADGQQDDEDYTYASFLQSKMYKHGVKCSNCHNPHTGKLLIAGNGLCLQCHDKKYDAPTHTFHAVNTAGADCKSCHMPGKFYMGNDFRHDHIFRAPRPDLSVKYGTPNACNNCHTDKSADWAAAAIAKWFGPNRPYHFAEDLIPGSRMDAASQAHLVKLIQDTATPPIIAATAVHYLADIPNNTGALANVLGTLNNSDAQVRYRAVVGLNNFSPSLWSDAIQNMLTDKVRAVRIAAANLVLGTNDRDLMAGLGEAYTKALQELQDNVLYQTDFASGNIMAADYYLKRQDYTRAESFYLKGLQKDNQMNYARLNLATVYNIQGNNQAALKTLEDAVKTDPNNERIYFNLALLYNELKQPENVEKSLKKAIELKTTNPRVYYNYAILLQQKQQYKPAEQQYLKALQLAPTDADINYALCVLHLQQKNPEAAKPYAQTLKRYYPGDQRFLQLWQQLGML